ncbi:MAG: nuclear transport factor 2 family protein [Gammaproteobacteria bacterium]|nr:nuclear transport factor 2 family protein [Gammaproteobacteria bacterium]
MSNLIETVKRYSKAFHTRDFETIRNLLHKNYRFKGPLMKMNGTEELIAFMENMPFECDEKNVRYVQDGNVVVKIFDTVFSKPFKDTVSMCEVLVFEGNRIKKCELFYDTAPFPKGGAEKAA